MSIFEYDVEYYFDKQEALEKVIMRYFDKPERTEKEKKEIKRVNKQIDKIGEIILEMLK